MLRGCLGNLNFETLHRGHQVRRADRPKRSPLDSDHQRPPRAPNEWRLRLMEFDYEIVYRPGRVHQVPDALSRLLREGGAEDDATIDEEITSFRDQHRV